MISLVELEIIHKDEYLFSVLGLNEFFLENYIVKWKTIGTLPNKSYNNTFTKYINTRKIDDNWDNTNDYLQTKNSFIDLLDICEYEDLFQYIKHTKETPIFRLVIAFDELNYLGIVDWNKITAQSLNFIDIVSVINKNS